MPYVLSEDYALVIQGVNTGRVVQRLITVPDPTGLVGVTTYSNQAFKSEPRNYTVGHLACYPEGWLMAISGPYEPTDVDIVDDLEGYKELKKLSIGRRRNG